MVTIIEGKFGIGFRQSPYLFNNFGFRAEVAEGNSLGSVVAKSEYVNFFESKNKKYPLIDISKPENKELLLKMGLSEKLIETLAIRQKNGETVLKHFIITDSEGKKRFITIPDNSEVIEERKRREEERKRRTREQSDELAIRRGFKDRNEYYRYMDKLSPLEKEKELLRMQFEEKISKEDANGCLNWIGSLIEDGYGMFYYNGKPILAHRYAYIRAYGEIPKDKPYILHTCNNSSCVNHKHLYAGTQADNMKQMEREGRGVHPKGEENSNAKLNWDIVNQMREKYKNGMSLDEISKEYGVPMTTVYHIICNDNWKDENYKHVHRSGHEGERSRTAKLTWIKVREIRDKYKNGYIIASLAREYNVKWGTIKAIVTNETWCDEEYQKWIDANKP